MRTIRNILKIVLPVLVVMIMASSLSQVKVFAAESINTTRQVSLTLNYLNSDDRPVVGAKFRLYKVADFKKGQVLHLTEDFSKYSIEINGLKDSEWTNLAGTLAGYVEADRITPYTSGVIGTDGTLLFDSGQVSQGLYLIIGEQIKLDDSYNYNATPYLISLPYYATGGKLVYDVFSDVKHSRVGENFTLKKISITVLKKWKRDSNYIDERPKKVTVQLLCDGTVIKKAELTAGNDWKYTWENLEDGHTYRIVETDVPFGYTVVVAAEKNSFIVTNEYNPPQDKEKVEEEYEELEKLPQTGTLWWLVPILVAVGLVTFAIGWIRRRAK